MIADRFAKLLKGSLFKEYRDIVFNNVSQYPKDHQDPSSVFRNLKFKAQGSQLQELRDIVLTIYLNIQRMISVKQTVSGQ